MQSYIQGQSFMNQSMVQAYNQPEQVLDTT